MKHFLPVLAAVAVSAACRAQDITAQDAPHAAVFDTFAVPTQNHSPSAWPDAPDALPGGGMSASQRGIFLDGKRISVAEAKDYARPFPAAIRHIRTGRFVYILALAGACTGGYMMGWEAGRAIRGAKVHTGTLVAGAVIAGGSIGLTWVTVAQYKKAAAVYNSATGLASMPRRGATLALAPTVGGLGMRLTF